MARDRQSIHWLARGAVVVILGSGLLGPSTLLGATWKETLAAAKKEGKEVFYSVNTKSIAKSLRGLASCLESCCKPSKKKGGRK